MQEIEKKKKKKKKKRAAGLLYGCSILISIVNVLLRYDSFLIPDSNRTYAYAIGDQSSVYSIRQNDTKQIIRTITQHHDALHKQRNHHRESVARQFRSASISCNLVTPTRCCI
ncbi:hypothetical protein V1478_008114, partial [Vespula squamosa]